jgi:hypothetical protein
MKNHEREYFIARIRSGAYRVEQSGITLKIISPTIDDEYAISVVYMKSYERALEAELMTEDEMLDWMRSKYLWTEDDDTKTTTIEKDLERLRVEIFNCRYQSNKREHVRKYIRAAETALNKQSTKKHENQQNTCEGIANLEKSLAFIKQCTFIGNEPCDFESIDITNILYEFNSMILKEKDIRELARNDPWRSLWLMRESCDLKLFANQDRELSIDQKNLLVWSRMYDNIQESMDCPTDDVIDDDDLLDGWFIIQRKKQEKERAESELENRVDNEKISNSQEVFIIAETQKDAENINQVNTYGSQMIKKERMAVIKEKGEAKDLDFRDQQIKMNQLSNEQFKGKFRR